MMLFRTYCCVFTLFVLTPSLLLAQQINPPEKLAFDKLQSGEYRAAIYAYDDVISSNPREASLHYYQGICYYQLKHYERAIRSFTRAIVLDKTVGYFYLRAKSYAHLEVHDKALIDYDKAIRLLDTQNEIHNSDYFHNRGISRYELDQFELALEDFNYAIHLDPKVAKYFYSRGKCFLSMGKREEACEDLHRAVFMKVAEAEPLAQQLCNDPFDP